MSRFKRLSLDESKEEFPLLNAEARKALKGGCLMCEEWRKEYPGITIYTEAEYTQMSLDGTWKTAAVCGIGLDVLGAVTVTGDNSTYCLKHFWPFADKECNYCYFDSLQYCEEHQEYFGSFGYCEGCNEYESYNNYYDESGNSTSGSENNSGNSGTSGNGGSESGSDGNGTTTKTNVELMKQEHYVGYDVTKDCMKGCKAIMDNYQVGYGSSAQVYRLLYENNGQLQHFRTDISTNYQNAIACIDRHLEADRPIIVGVNHHLGININEGTTDHFIVITGRGYDETEKKYYYTYIDPARNAAKAAEACNTENNRLYYDSENNTLRDTTAGSSGSRTYDVVQVRPNDGLNLSETVSLYVN